MKDYKLMDYELTGGYIFIFASRFIPSKDPNKEIELDDILLGTREYNGSYSFTTDAEKYEKLLLNSDYATAYRCWHYSIISQRKSSIKEPLKTKEEEEREHWREFAEERNEIDRRSELSEYKESYLEGYRDGLTERAIELLQEGYQISLIHDITKFCIPRIEALAQQHNISLESLTRDFHNTQQD